MESGTPGFGQPFRSLTDAERIGDQADALLGAGGEIAKMRKMSVPALLAVDLKLHDDALESNSMLWLRTTVDGKVFPADPRSLLDKAPAKSVILGTNRVEFGVERPHRDPLIAKAFGARAAEARALYRSDQPDPPSDPRLGTLDDQIGTDVIFRCPTERMAQILSAKGAAVWRYEFDAAPGGGKTSHAAEIQYAFGDATFDHGLSLKPYWLNFMLHGDPNGAGLAQWPRFTPADRAHVLFSDAGVAQLGALKPEVCSMLDRI